MITVKDKLQAHFELMDLVNTVTHETVDDVVLFTRDLQCDEREAFVSEVLYQAATIWNWKIEVFADIAKCVFGVYGPAFAAEMERHFVARWFRRVKHTLVDTDHAGYFRSVLTFGKCLCVRGVLKFGNLAAILERNFKRNHDFALLVWPFFHVFQDELKSTNGKLYEEMDKCYETNSEWAPVSKWFDFVPDDASELDRVLADDDVEKFQDMDISKTIGDDRKVLMKCIEYNAMKCWNYLFMNNCVDKAMTNMWVCREVAGQAIRFGRTDIIRFLEEKGISFSEYSVLAEKANALRRLGGKWPLYYNLQDMYVTDKFRFTDYLWLADRAIRHHRRSIFDWIVGSEHTVSLAELRSCISSANSGVILQYWDQFVAMIPELKPVHMKNLLKYAMLSGFTESIEFLFGCRADVQYLDLDLVKSCALFGGKRLLRMYLESKVCSPTDAVSEETGVCLSHYYVKKGNVEMLSVLASADPEWLSPLTRSGKNALDFAVAGKHEEACEFLQKFLKKSEGSSGGFQLFPAHAFVLAIYGDVGFMRFNISTMWSNILLPHHLKVQCTCDNKPCDPGQQEFPERSLVVLKYEVCWSDCRGCTVREARAAELFKQVAITAPLIK